MILKKNPYPRFGLNKCIDRLIQAINGFLNKVRGSLKSALEKFKTEITNVKNAIKKYVSDLCNDIQRKFQELLPQPQLGMAGANGSNIPTGRYDVNVQSGKSTSTTHNQKEKTPEKEKPPKDKKDHDPCKLTPYGWNVCNPLGKAGHHVVPDRAFRLGKRKNDRKPIPNTITEAEGLAICASKTGSPSEHKRIHNYYDPRERVIGLNHKPQFTSTLIELELLGSAAVSFVLKCHKMNIMQQLRTYHLSKGMGPD